MRKLLLLLTVLLLMFRYSGMGQSYGTDPSVQPFTNIIPASPTAATLLKFANTPVSYSTGVPQISIPLYTIKLKDFSFPVSMDFHAGGRRASLDFSSLGIGWALNVSGSYITREIRDLPDEFGFLPLGLSASDVQAGCSTYLNTYGQLIRLDMVNGESTYLDNYGYSAASHDAASTRQDSQYDIYTYSINGQSGKFIIIDGSVIQLNYSNLKIVGSSGGTFTIIDEKGVTYYFGNNGIANSSAQEYTLFTAPNTNQETDLAGYNGRQCPIAWYLSRIIMRSGDQIAFAYKSQSTLFGSEKLYEGGQPYNYATYGTHFLTNMDNQYVEGSGTTPQFYIFDQNYNSNFAGLRYHEGNSTTQYSISYLSGITFPGGRMALNYDDQNQDPTLNTLQLKSILVTNTLGIQIKNMTFNIQRNNCAFTPNNNSVNLSSFSAQGDLNSPVEIYNFTYYGGCVTTANHLRYQDMWGYSAGEGNSTAAMDGGLSSTPPTGTGGACASCEQPSFDGARAGMLKTITYPTGGTTDFTYEPNICMAQGASSSFPGPGIRIQKIVTDDGTGVNPVTKLYKYGVDEDGIGYLPYAPNADDFQFTTTYYGWDVPPGGTGTGVLAAYNYTTYTIDPVAKMAEAYRQPVTYSTVAEYTRSADGSLNGKTVYNYDTQFSYTQNAGNFHAFRMNNYTGGKLTGKTVYKYQPQQNAYVPVESSTTGYDFFHQATTKQIAIWRLYTVEGADEANPTNSISGLPNQPLTYADDPIYSGVQLPVGETHSVYDSNGNAPVTTSIQYSYNNNNGAATFPVSTQTTTSLGDILDVETKYPFDITTGTDSLSTGVQGLLTSNIITPVETSSYRMNTHGSNKRLISSVLNCYYGLKPYKILSAESAYPMTNFTPLYLSGSSLVKDSRYVEKQYFDNYDTKLDLLEQHAASNSHTCYVWSYQGQYPVAEIKNAAYSTVQAVLGSAGISSMFSENPDDGTLATFLAPLRTDSRLSGAQVTSFTYNPLIGMTSMTDPKNEVSYFTYDSNRRLQGVWDQNKNLVRSYCYNYKNQLTGCPVLSTPGQIYVRFEQTNQQQNSQSDGGSGFIVTYTFDMTAHFYSNAACTQPLAIPQGLTLQLNEYGSFYNATTQSYSSDNNANYYTAGAGDTIAYIGNLTSESDHYYYDQYSNYLDDTAYYSYEPLTYGNSTYLIVN